MPSFSQQIANLPGVGPVVEVLISPPRVLVDSLKAKGRPAATPVKVMAMIDTGATMSVVTPSVIKGLGLQPISVGQMSTPSTVQSVSANIYNVAVAFPNGVMVDGINVIEAPLGGQPIQCLIGRDVLRHGVLVYIGYLGQFTLSF